MFLIVGIPFIFIILAGLALFIKLKNNFEDQIKMLKIKAEEEKKKALNTQRSVVRGAISEELAPLLPNFPYNGSDCKFLGQPFDYLVLDGMSKFRDTGEGEIKLVLLEIKTGNSRLTKVEKAIKEAVEKGNIEFKTIKL